MNSLKTSGTSKGNEPSASKRCQHHVHWALQWPSCGNNLDSLLNNEQIKKMCVFIHTEVLFGFSKREKSILCNSTDQPEGHYANSNKLGTEREWTYNLSYLKTLTFGDLGQCDLGPSCAGTSVGSWIARVPMVLGEAFGSPRGLLWELGSVGLQ